MLPNLSALALERREAPTEGLFGKKKTPEEKAAKKRDEVLAGFKERLVTFFLATCHWRMSGQEKPEAIVPEEYGFEKESNQPPPASAQEEAARQGREDRFDSLKEKASYCERTVKHFTKGDEDETKTKNPRIAWDVLVNYYKDEDNKPILESIMDATMLMTHMRFYKIDEQGRTVKDRWKRKNRWWEAYNEIMESAGWKTNSELYTKGNKASKWADAYIERLKKPKPQ